MHVSTVTLLRAASYAEITDCSPLPALLTTYNVEFTYTLSVVFASVANCKVQSYLLLMQKHFVQIYM